MIQLKSLTKIYRTVKAVDGVDLSIDRGAVFGLLGPNGAGKSTTISMISTLLKPTSGQVLYKGVDVVEQPKLIRPQLGIVPQEIALYQSLSGLDNLKFWGSAYGLKGARLKRRIDEVAQIIGIDERLNDVVSTYSGGMQRRLNIGAALLHEPELLIMDEPTVGIDPQSRNHILEAVKQLNARGVTIIYTSHYMEEVEAICGKIAIMDKGKVIAEGAPAELQANFAEKCTIKLLFSGQSESFLEQLSNHPAVDGVALFDNQLALKCVDSLVVKDVFAIAEKTSVEIFDIDIEQPNLESAFLKLTGKALRD